MRQSNNYMSYTYCFEANNYKEAYQQALIIASEKYFSLNETGDYNFLGIGALSPLDMGATPLEYQDLMHPIYNVDETKLKLFQNDLAHHLSVA